MHERNRDTDKRILISILVDIEKGLVRIIAVPIDAARRGRFLKGFAELIPGPWDEVARSFNQARAPIEKEDLDWQYVEGIGLTGRMLEWKRSMLDRVIQHGGIRRILKIANSLLGSLSGAIPVLEIAKEYKENIEAAMARGAD